MKIPFGVKSLLFLCMALPMVAAFACGGETEVIVDRTVEVPVVQTVLVEKEGETKIVEKEVQVVQTVVVTKEGETKIVEKEVPVVQTVVVTKEGETKIVEKEVQVVQTVVVEKEVPIEVRDERFGGELRYSMMAGIPTVDAHKTTACCGWYVVQQVQEPLFAMDAQLNPQPMLAESWTANADLTDYSITLRSGLKFHDGTPLNSTHAVTSWERFANRDVFGKILLGFIDTIQPAGDLSFSIKLNEGTGLILDGLGRVGGYSPVMMPPEMYDVPVDVGADVILGTGPFKFASWVPGDNLTIERWDDYQPVNKESSFLSGHKTAYMDTIVFLEIPDSSARIAALETGQVDAVDTVDYDSVPQLDANPNVAVKVKTTSADRHGLWPNHLRPPFDDKRVRKAMQLAYPNEETLFAITGDERFYRLCPSMMVCGSKYGDITDGSNGIYNVQDIEGAKALIAEAGYTGHDVVIMSPEDRVDFATGGLVAKQVAEDLGFNVIYKSTDWKTIANWRTDPDLWSLMHIRGGFSWGGISPLLNSTLSAGTYWNKYQDESGNTTRLMAEFARAPDDAARKAIISDLQKQYYEDYQYFIAGDIYPVEAARTNVQGMVTLYGSAATLWNVWKD